MYSVFVVLLVPIVPLLISMCEACVISQWLPEFRGTYDDRQDEMLTVDWSAQEDFDSELVRQGHRSEEMYSERLSKLRLLHQDLLKRDAQKKAVRT